MRLISARNVTAAVVLGGVAAGCAFMAVAAASIPDAGGVIHGCYNKSGGALRVIDSDNPAKKCTSTQVPLTWNQAGVPGPPGAAGVSGYVQVNAQYTNPANTQTPASATCPAGTKVVGGGVFGSGDLKQSLNSSFPLGDTTWKVYVNNAGTTGSSFSVYAICVIAN